MIFPALKPTTPRSVRSVKDVRSARTEWTLLPLRIQTLVRLVNKIVCGVDSSGHNGGSPSYSTAALVSFSKLGVFGAFKEEEGLEVTWGRAICAIPSMKTCWGVAPRASGWLSQRTMSKGDITIKSQRQRSFLIHQRHILKPRVSLSRKGTDRDSPPVLMNPILWSNPSVCAGVEMTEDRAAASGRP